MLQVLWRLYKPKSTLFPIQYSLITLFVNVQYSYKKDSWMKEKSNEMYTVLFLLFAVSLQQQIIQMCLEIIFNFN